MSKLQEDLNSVKYLVIYEFSVIGQKMFAWINRLCKQATGLILCGDIAQLLPISDQVLYHNKPKNDLAVEGYCMYQKFQTVVKLQTNEWTKGSKREQENFGQLQRRGRNGDSPLEDWKLHLARNPDKTENLQHFEDCAIKLSFGNEEVAKDNYNKLCDLGHPIIQINPQHTSNKAKNFSAEDMGGLKPVLYLAKKSRVMLTPNLWAEVGLCNDALGTVHHVIYAEGNVCYQCNNCSI